MSLLPSQINSISLRLTNIRNNNANDKSSIVRISAIL